MIKNNTELHSMKLHEDDDINERLGVIRVPGGWIYKIYNISNGDIHPVFVPWENEFWAVNK